MEVFQLFESMAKVSNMFKVLLLSRKANAKLHLLPIVIEMPIRAGPPLETEFIYRQEGVLSTSTKYPLRPQFSVEAPSKKSKMFGIKSVFPEN
jgi:hypothetical protein